MKKGLRATMLMTLSMVALLGWAGAPDAPLAECGDAR
jgi:hypothetical protein